jgi:hypothetical protein
MTAAGSTFGRRQKACSFSAERCSKERDLTNSVSVAEAVARRLVK